MLLRAALMGWLMSAQVAVAQDAEPFTAQDFDVSGLIETLPDKTLKNLREQPEQFIEAATELILGYGGAQGIGPEGIENAIRVRRGYVRSREMRRVLLPDLDNDDQVSTAEVAVLIPTESVGRRARLLMTHRAADENHDGMVVWDELREFADAKAVDSLTREHAAIMHALMGLGHNGDGLVAIDEIILTVQAFSKDV
ncbi:MAG: hypothetical protein ACI8R4_004286 [Paracoccaceae bacterium]|jgi:hypothetical protein